MISYNDLTKGTKEKEASKYFEDFFTKENFKEYSYDEDLNPDEVKAIKTMFTSKKDLAKRIDEALRLDPLCIEAIYTYSILGDDTYVFLRFESFYKQINNYADFSNKQKRCFLEVLNLYVEFLLDIQNISYAIKVQKTLIRLSGIMNSVFRNRLSFMYAILEDSDEAYRLYLDTKFDAYDYILLIISLLKNEDELRAKEVLYDMVDNIEDGKYIDHIWDLDKDNAFYKIVDECFETINSIPTFFSWANVTLENRV